MSSTIPEAMVVQFGQNYRILAQQRTSRLWAWCQTETNIVGKSKSVERIGAAEAYDIQSRGADTKFVDTPHSRRWLDLADKGWADLVDELDKIKLLADPTSDYVRAGVMALNRKKDVQILKAAIGSARAGTDASATTVALPTAQKIANGGTGLTLSKLLTTKQILDDAEVDIEQEGDGQASNLATRVIVVSATQIGNLLGTTEIKSVDYNNVKALAAGAIDTFMGFKFVRLPSNSAAWTTAANIRSCVAWSRNCVAAGLGMDIKTSIDPRPDKNYSVQVYARESIGAVRIEDAGVVQIDCAE